jgi:hypothetical protein
MKGPKLIAINQRNKTYHAPKMRQGTRLYNYLSQAHMALTLVKLISVFKRQMLY